MKLVNNYTLKSNSKIKFVYYGCTVRGLYISGMFIEDIGLPNINWFRAYKFPTNDLIKIDYEIITELF